MRQMMVMKKREDYDGGRRREVRQMEKNTNRRVGGGEGRDRW